MAGRIAPLQRSPRRSGIPLPGVGGYDMPRGPYGEGGFPGSTPAAPATHPQSPDGQRGARPQLSATANQQQWATLPTRTRSGLPRNPHARNQPLATGLERRSSPAINEPPPGDQKQRNTIYYGGVQALPSATRAYLSAPNPGKNGGTNAIDGSGGFSTDAGNVAGGDPSTVVVPSRFVAPPDLDGYAMDRPEAFDRTGPRGGPGYAAFAAGYRGDYHIRGGRLDGTRYFGALADQQRIGLPSDAYGIARRRGPNHRPVRFEVPPPWSVNYYDVPPEVGTQSPDMIHQSPGGGRRTATRKDRSRSDRTEHRPQRGSGKRRG